MTLNTLPLKKRLILIALAGLPLFIYVSYAVITMLSPGNGGFALLGVAFFPVGLLALTSLHGGGFFMLAWAFYAVLLISLFTNNKKKVFYTLYTILLVTIIFNVAGCYQMFKHPNH
jgi:hypothetical protein